MRIIVGLTGASGVAMGYALILALKAQPGCEVHLVITEGGLETWRLESPRPVKDLKSAADFFHDDRDLSAVIASGSFETAGMIVLPCSMKTLAAVSHGYAAGLLTRAADVCLKEGRKLVLCPREMPLGKVHLRNMAEAADLGCVIIPPMLTFYNQPRSLDDQVDHVIGKIMMQFGLRHRGFRAWTGGGHD